MENSTVTKSLDYIPFAIKYSLKERIQKSKKQRQEKQGYIPLIIEKNPKSKLPRIDKVRFVCQGNNKFYLVQKMIENKVQKAAPSVAQKQGKLCFFLSINNQVPKVDELMSDLDKRFRAQDGFVYVQYGQMETFGK